MKTAAAAAVEAPTVLFDFDGTLGDTETPAMEVAYWELVPYFANIKVSDINEETMRDFIRESAGKAFEFMVDKCNEDRIAAGLPPLEETRASKTEDPEILAVVDGYRKKFGLKTFAEMRASGGEEPEDFLVQQKDDTVLALETLAEACPGVKNTLEWLTSSGYKFAIATTSGKPRVPVSVIASGLDTWFSPDKIHSGESDFDPPRFKPDPSVYLLAAKSENSDIAHCIAVEDSASGVGSAANAGVGMIVGYVGASHIAEEVVDSHSKMLMAGEKADSGIGADLVISDMNDLPTLVSFFAELERPVTRPVQIPEEILKALKGRYWLRD
eukprot:CAMPEP_0117657770 /NCGR_PEP_ID=MMETSP0804-20121206/5506_1 /TAXON_ID=1074897 /ORGANISM="Tetraselmis astigmatica, Strain CCMP880" /LENGTH=326 /DNA_ID=CAMNT_0005464243 /DNA_START=426 /DNA_END=1406 /DNA_ORIENTATION=+